MVVSSSGEPSLAAASAACSSKSNYSQGEGTSLNARFFGIYEQYTAYHEGAEKCETPAQFALEIRMLITAVERESFFSSNEDIEEIGTKELKFMLLPAIYGDVQAMNSDMETRKKSLEKAIVSWQMYLSRASRYNLIDTEDQEVAFGEFDELQRRARPLQRDEKVSILLV